MKKLPILAILKAYRNIIPKHIYTITYPAIDSYGQ